MHPFALAIIILVTLYVIASLPPITAACGSPHRAVHFYKVHPMHKVTHRHGTPPSHRSHAGLRLDGQP